MRISYSFLLFFFISCAFAAIILSAGMGFMPIAPDDICIIILHRLFSFSLPQGIENAAVYVVCDVRLPRIIMAVLVGAGLAISGVIYQGILLNPLADPYTLGISSGAAFGASVSLLLGIHGIATGLWLSSLSTPLFAFLGAICTLLIVLRLASFNGQVSAQSLILSGVIVGAILSAGISFMKYIAGDQVAVIIFWLMGSLAGSSWNGVLVLLIILLFCMGTALFFARDLDIISLGRRSSDSLGVETVTVRKILLLSASLLAAVCVSFTGIIGFIGLIIPHITRYLTGANNRRLLPIAALCGSLLLLCADTITRAVLPMEVPIGILTALVGGPFFCLIFRQKQRENSYE